MLNLNAYSSRILHNLTEINGNPLPTRGLVAGNAVANLILRYIWGGNYPVSSIDFFIEEVDLQPDTSLFPFRTTGYYVDNSFRQPSLAKIGFKVLKISKEGFINRILIRKNEPVFGDDNKRHAIILNGFSLNCFMVGIDLSNGNVFCAKAFERLLQDGQLLVHCPVTPYQTTILLPHIQHELGCYLNLREEIGLLASYEKACRMGELYCSYAGSFAAKRYLPLFQLYQEALAPFCRLVEFTPPVLPGLEAFMDSRFALDYRAELHNNLLIEQLLERNIGFDSYSFSLAYNHVVRASSPQKCRDRFIMAVSWGGVPSLAVVLNPESIQLDMQNKFLTCIELFSRKHPACMKKLLDMGLTIQDQYKAIRLMQALSRKKGDIIFGLIENSHHLGIPVTEITESVLNSLMDAFMALEGEALIEPLNLDDYKYRAYVSELTTAAQLKMESSIMRHCIQTYSAAVKERNCRVFHIFKGGRHSTAAIYPECEFEIHGPRNSDPPPEHIEIAESLSRVIWKGFEHTEECPPDLDGEDQEALFFESG